MDFADGMISVAFLTIEQMRLYGGYKEACAILGVEAIRGPDELRHFHADLCGHYPQVGHG